MNSFSFINSFVFKEVTYTGQHHSNFPNGANHNYLMYLKKGTATIYFENKSIEITSDDLLYIPRGLKYRVYMEGFPEILFYSLAYLNFPNNVLQTNYAIKIERTDEIMNLLNVLTSDNLSDCKMLGIFYLLLDKLQEQTKDHNTIIHHVTLEKAMNYVIINPHCNIPDIAKYCCISEAELYKLFKKYTNTTPAQFKLKVKLEKAVHYIISTDIPIEDISDLCGFSSPSYFRKNFYKRYLTTPSEMRKNLIKNKKENTQLLP